MPYRICLLLHWEENLMLQILAVKRKKWQ